MKQDQRRVVQDLVLNRFIDFLGEAVLKDRVDQNGRVIHTRDRSIPREEIEDRKVVRRGEMLHNKLKILRICRLFSFVDEGLENSQPGEYRQDVKVFKLLLVFFLNQDFF